MKVILTGGGTAGHIQPALAIAEQLQVEVPSVEILYVGTPDSMEQDLAYRAGYRFEAITVKGFRRKLSMDTLKTIGKLLKGLTQAWILLGREKPDVVIGTGGYVCGPVVFLAALRRIPTVIHEQNVFPGVTNRILSRFVDGVCVAYEESRGLFPKAKRLIVTGNPVKRDFVQLDKTQCRESLKIASDAFFVLSLGGSGGAARINRAVGEIIPQLSQGTVWTHITGKNYYEGFRKEWGEGNPPKVTILPYSYEMPQLIGAADIVVSRSGALTLAELATAGVPAILVPSPNVANDHQTFNAEACKRLGMAELISDKDLTGIRLLETVEALQRDRNRLAEMKKACESHTMENAAGKITEEIHRLKRT